MLDLHMPDPTVDPHAEKLQAARGEAAAAEARLELRMSLEDASDIARLIDAKVELALLERGGG